jgi:CheY-like chemotaxis protein
VLSHELRTPLTPVLALATAAQSDPELPDAVRADFATIRRNIELEAKLIDDLLDLTRIGRGKISLRLDTVDMHQAIRHAINVCSGDEMSMKRLSLHVNLHAMRHQVRGDAARLQQICWNLLKNAVKFTPPGGRIAISTSNDARNRLILVVSDSGAGMEPHVLPRIFEAFEQGEASATGHSGGLGLGLAISKGLVAAHGGTITAHSDGLGKGATFTVTLDTVAEALPVPAAAAPEAPTQHGSRLSILLVEDHADTSRALKRLLSKQGYDVRAADSLEAALSLASQSRFDVIVSDLGLPDGSGLELMRQIRGLGGGDAQAKGIALTGFGMEEDVMKSREAGFTEHLTKPVSFNSLKKAIERVMAKS